MTDLHHVHHYVADLERSVAEYCELLGAEIESRSQVGPQEIVFLRLGSGRLAMSQATAERPVGINHLGIAVPDIASASKALIAAGWQAEADMREVNLGKIQFVHSPDGIRMELIQLR